MLRGWRVRHPSGWSVPAGGGWGRIVRKSRYIVRHINKAAVLQYWQRTQSATASGRQPRAAIAVARVYSQNGMESCVRH